MMEWIQKKDRTSSSSVVKKYLSYVESSILPEAKKSLEGKGKFLEIAENRDNAKNGLRMAGNPLSYLDCINEIHPKQVCNATSKLLDRVTSLETKYQNIADAFEKHNLIANAAGEYIQKMCPIFIKLKKAGWVNINPRGGMNYCMGDSCPEKTASNNDSDPEPYKKLLNYDTQYNAETKGENFDYRKCPKE